MGLMALAGIHVECSRAGAVGESGSLPVLNAIPLWSENKTTAGTTTASAPSTQGEQALIFTITAAADAWIAIGAAPDASVDPRRFLPAGIPRDFEAAAGDKVAWAAA
jgi:hypothetical protein